jgi:CHAT domain-containing protein
MHEKATAKKVTIAIPNSLTLNGHNYLRLIQADEEAAELARLYAGTRELRGNAVTSANIAKELPQADIFEFAGHAVTRQHGGELVVQGEGQAEIVSGISLAKLRLHKTHLVVLSACSTGPGLNADRDPSGLVRALLNAGTSRVIATRWDVDSGATADAMKLFYRSLKKGMNEGQALQAARKNLSAEDKFAHPYYWAGIELFGNN